MRTIRRIVAVVLAAALIALTLAGCSSDDLTALMEFYETYEEMSETLYGDYGNTESEYYDYFSQMYDDYYSYSDDSDYYSDYYYGDDGYYSGTDNSGNSYSDYMDFYSYFSDYMNEYSNAYGGLESADSGYSSNGSTTAMTISSNILGEALREQFTDIQGNGQDKVTVMVYLCGSNLESESGLASMDIKEMARAAANENLRIIVECGGTKSWKINGVSSNANTRIAIENGSAVILEKNQRSDMTDGDTLTDFITYCADEYPADRYMLILWDHGAGAVDGWGYDEYNYYDALTIDELGEALHASGVKFDFVGFDACLMSTMEVACVLYDFADYMIASEDYESGYGWEYQYWLDALSKNTSIPTPELGQMICDDFVDESGSDAAILSIVDLSYMKLVYSSWKDFAYAAKDQLLDANFSWETQNTSRIGGDRDRYSLEDILGSVISTEAEIEDMMAIAYSVENVPEAEALISALENAIIYCSANSKDAHMTGLAVTLPYGDAASYRDIQKIFAQAGFDEEYIDFLGEFVNVSTAGSSYDWSDWYDSYDGYDSWSDYYSDDSYTGSDYGWDSWYGWDDYNSGDYGWSDYDYYDYYSGESEYDYYDFFDYYDFYSDFFGTGSGSYGGNDYSNGSGYGSEDDLFGFFW